MPFFNFSSNVSLLTVQPFGHIPTDMIVRLQFHIIVPCNKINLSSNNMVLKPELSDVKSKLNWKKF
jgi:hypothetical protein